MAVKEISILGGPLDGRVMKIDETTMIVRLVIEPLPIGPIESEFDIDLSRVASCEKATYRRHRLGPLGKDYLLYAELEGKL